MKFGACNTNVRMYPNTNEDQTQKKTFLSMHFLNFDSVDRLGHPQVHGMFP